MVKLCNLGVTLPVLVIIKYGLGVHTIGTPLTNIEQIQQVLWATTLLFFLGISSSKISVLIYYGKTFRVRTHPNKVWRWAFYFVFAITVASLIAFALAWVFHCQPVQQFWSPSRDGRCSSFFLLLFSNAICSAILDILILLSPLPPIWKLTLEMSRKWALTGVFILGYS